MVATHGRSPVARSSSAHKGPWNPGSCVMPSLTPRMRSGPPMKRPPHIVGSRGANASGDKPGALWCINAAKEAAPQDPADDLGHVAIMGAPPFPSEEMGVTTRPPSRGSITLASLTGRTSPSQEHPQRDAKDDVAQCGGQAPRPDTCHLTHVYVKQELNYLARRVDEISRYFIALEQMVGTGAIGPLLNRSLHELEAKIEAADTIDDIDEVQGFIDAAIRLGISPKRYAPLRSRYAWLESGIYREELRRRLAELRDDAGDEEANDATALQQLIDNCVRLGIASTEVAIARQRLQEVEQRRINREMLAAAGRGDTTSAGFLVERGAKTAARDTEGGSSLWHLAAASNDVKIASFAAKLDSDVHLMDEAGHTALMVAALRQNQRVLTQLLERGADPNAQSRPVENLIECADEAAVSQVHALLSVSNDRRISHALPLAGLYFDIGDKLVSGDDLQLPVFRRLAGRTALHLVVSRAGPEGAEVPILETLVRHAADVNATDELGRTPLWYAARAGRAGSARTLLRHGASVIIGGGVSPLVAAARSHTSATNAGNAKAAAELVEVLRLLLRTGASSEKRDAAEYFQGDMSEICRTAYGMQDAMTMSGGTPTALEDLRTAIRGCQSRCSDRLVLQRSPRLASAAEAATFAAVALPDFQVLSFHLARLTGGRATLCRPPTATRVMRFARQLGLVHNSNVDWYRVTGIVHGSILYEDIQSIQQAMLSIESECRHHIRSIQDRLLVPPPGGRSGVSVIIEVCGVLCAMNLTLKHVVELEERGLEDGRWMREELGSAITRGSHAEVVEIMEYATEHIEPLRIAQVLRMPLTTMAYSPTGAPPSGGDPAVCVAVQLGHTNILEYLLSCHASPNVCAADGTSALMLACTCRNLACFWLLLSCGADPAEVDFDRVRGGDFKAEARRMITQVINQRHIDSLALADLVEKFDGSSIMLKSAQRLLEAGSDANMWISGKAPPYVSMPLLSSATRQGSAPLVMMLLEFGANIRCTAGPHSVLHLAHGTPVEVIITRHANEEMHLALAATDIPAVHKLLEAGMNPEYIAVDSSESREGRTLIEYAVDLPVELGHPLLEDLLQRGANVNQPGYNSQTVLLSVIQACAPIKYVETLLAYDADPSLANKQGVNAAMMAASTGSSTTLILLLEAGNRQGVDAGLARDSSGKDATMHALAALQSEIVDMLLVRDYHLDKLGCISELFDTCRNVDYPRARRLLDIIIPVYCGIASATEDGVEGEPLPTTPTLLMEAVRSQHVDIVKLLLENGACLYPCCMDGCSSVDDGSLPPSPTFSARESAWSLAGNSEALRAALRWCLPSELIKVARRNDSVALANLKADEVLGLSPDPEEFKLKDEKGFGALDYTLIHENEDMEEWFVVHGACYQSDMCRNTALLEPVKIGDAVKTSRRLRAGADYNAVDSAGYTALDWSVLAAIMNGNIWYCVESAMEMVIAQQMMDINTERPDDLASALRGGSRGSVGSESGSLKDIGSLRDLSMSTSVGGSSRPRFNMSDEVIEFGKTPNESLHSIGEGQSSSTFGSSPNTFGGPKRTQLSVGAMSVTGRSRSSIGGTSARSGGGHMKRKKPDPKPDPRGVHVAVEEALVQAGACFGEHVREAKYVLWEPLMRRDLETVRRRILAGADCTLLNEKGTALTHIALDMASPGVASALVQNGASPDRRDHRGRTVLWRAIELKQPELAEVCVDHGANLLLGLGEQNEGSLAFLAIETKQPQLAIKLLSAPGGCSPNVVAGKDRSLIWRAVELQQSDVVRECLKHDPDLDRTDDFTGNTILHVALEVEPTFVPDLISAGASADTPNKAGRTPLQIAAGKGQKEAVQAILDHGVRLGRFGGSPALEAIQADHLELALLLVESAGPAVPLRMSRQIHVEDNDSDNESKASFGGRSAVSTMSAATFGGRRSRVPRASKVATFESETTWQILGAAVTVGSREIVASFLRNALVGARVAVEYARDLALDLTEWIFADDHPEDRTKRAEAIQELPHTLFEEGAQIAAGDYLHKHCQLSEELIEKIAHAEPEGGARRGSFRASMSQKHAVAASLLPGMAPPHRVANMSKSGGESTPIGMMHKSPANLSLPSGSAPSSRRPGRPPATKTVEEEEEQVEQENAALSSPVVVESLSCGNTNSNVRNAPPHAPLDDINPTQE